jgi:uncharacterized membrane protein YdbT with pleckstrin-like domain
METEPTQSAPQPQTPPAPQPVAYDADGRPLYAAPPQTQYVHFSRATSPEKQPVSPELKAKHDESMRRYPHLNLSDGEYVLSAVRRHWIGMLVPAVLTVFLVAVVMSLAIIYPQIALSIGLGTTDGHGMVLLIGTLLSLLFLIGGYIALWVYTNNKFFLTNESVIQELQQSLFSRHEQTVSLANIEDASYRQEGLLQTMLNYGSIRLSTEGDETTYRFPYVTDPKREIALLNNAVEAFKNGRPIEDI